MPDIEGPYIVHPDCYSTYPIQFEGVSARGCPTCPVYKDCYVATAKSEYEKHNA